MDGGEFLLFMPVIVREILRVIVPAIVRVRWGIRSVRLPRHAQTLLRNRGRRRGTRKRRECRRTE